MRRTVRVWVGVVLAFLAVGGVTGALVGGADTQGRSGSAVIGVLCGYAALRVWAGPGRNRR